MLDVTTSRARSTAERVLAVPPAEARDRVLRAVAGMSRARVRSVVDDRIELSVRANRFSWGEIITIDLTPTEGGTTFTVRTRSVVPSTVYDWGEGARDIRTLHDAVADGDGDGDGDGDSGPERAVGAHPTQLGQSAVRPWPAWFAWVAVVSASVLILLALVNLVINTEHVGSWLPLLVLMPLSLVTGVRSLRARRTDGDDPDRRPRRLGRDH